MIKKNAKVTVWGDSILRGVVYDNSRQRYTFLKQSCLDLIQLETGINISNHSKFSQTTTRALEMLKKNIINDNDYDYGIIELGGNDSDFNWEKIAESPDIFHQPNTPIDEFLYNIEEMVNIFKSYNITPIIVNLPPISSNKYFNWITKDNSKERVMKWLKSEDSIYRYQEKYSLALTNLAYKLNVTLFDLRDKLLSDRNYMEYLCEDGIHLNENGHIYLKEIFCKYNKEKKINEKIPNYY